MEIIESSSLQIDRTCHDEYVETIESSSSWWVSRDYRVVLSANWSSRVIICVTLFCVGGVALGGYMCVCQCDRLWSVQCGVTALANSVNAFGKKTLPGRT